MSGPFLGSSAAVTRLFHVGSRLKVVSCSTSVNHSCKFFFNSVNHEVLAASVARGMPVAGVRIRGHMSRRSVFTSASPRMFLTSDMKLFGRFDTMVSTPFAQCSSTFEISEDCSRSMAAVAKCLTADLPIWLDSFDSFASRLLPRQRTAASSIAYPAASSADTQDDMNSGRAFRS